MLLSAILAAVCVASGNGEWSAAKSWADGKVPGRGDDVIISNREVTVRGPVEVKSLAIGGTAKVTFAAAPMKEIASTPENLYANATVVRVRERLAIGGEAVVTVENDPKTGAAVKFETGSFALGLDAELTASGKGWFWYESANDPLATLTQGSWQTRAPGAGGDDNPQSAYNRGGGYGAKGGNSNGKYGCAYGYKYAPFLSGSPNGIYGNRFNYAVRPGGTVWVESAGACVLLGKISADGATAAFGTGSGGGVWIAAKSLAVGPRASVSAVGGVMTGNACYASRGAGGRVSLAIGLTRKQLDELAAGKEPAGAKCADSIGVLAADVRGGYHVPAEKYGESGTATTVIGAGAAPVKFIKPDFALEPGCEDRRRACLGHSISNGVVVWKWGPLQNRMRVRTAPNGVLRTRKAVRKGDIVGWTDGKGTAFVEAVPDAGYRFCGWSGTVPAGKENANPLEAKITEPADFAPRFRPADPQLATLVAAPPDGVAKFAKPLELVGRPLSIGLELETAANGGTAVVEVTDRAKKTYVFKGPAKGSFPFVELEGEPKMQFPIALKRAEVEGASVKVKSVRAAYRTALGRAGRHFAANESRNQALAGAIEVTDEKPVEVEMDLVKRAGVRFVLGASKGSKLVIEWDDGTKSTCNLGIGAQKEKYLADFAGCPKGTPFTIPDSFVTFGGQILQYVRPFLRPYRSTSDMVPMGFDYIADHGQLPGASSHINDIILRRNPKGCVDLIWDGSLNNTFGPPRGKPNLRAKSAKFVFTKGVRYALKPEDTAGLDTDRYELLDFEANPRAKAMKDAVFAGDLKPGVREIGGVPVRLAKPLDSGDVAICHQGKGSWALEVDEYTGRRASDGFGAAVHFRVPARDYVKAHVVFALDPNERKDRVLTLRLARYFLNGAGSNMIGDRKLDLTKGLPESVRRIGGVVLDGATLPLYAATVDLNLTPVLDSAAREGYIDFEFIGVMKGSKPDPDRESAFNVFGATLEAAPVTLDIAALPGSPSNVFTQDEAKKATKLVFRGERAESKCRVELKATDFAEKETIFTKSFDVGPLAKGERLEKEIDLAKATEPGLYKLFIEVKGDGGATDYAYCSRFAVLPPAGRVVDKYASPYATWWFFGSHGSPLWEIGGPILQKAGIRKASHHNWPTNMMEKYDVTFTGNVRAPGQREFDAQTGKFKPHDCADGETWFVREVRKMVDSVPYADHIMIWHESGPKSTGIPEEILDLPVPAATDDDRVAGAYVNEIGRLVRKHFPKLRIQIGNNSASLGAACHPLRGGAKPEYYDSVGIETPSQAMMPERLLVWGLQGMMITKEAASYYAKKPVPACACFEYVYRTEKALGEALQAAWYMRDVLISLANRMPMISPAVTFDVRNAYYDTLWGRAGMLFRGPYCEPKLSYVAYAALTKALDGVTLVKELDTGSTTVYALLFRRADGKYATAVWCARGEAEVEIGVDGDGQVMDMVGKVTKLGGFFGGKKVQASECPSYVLTEKPVEKVTIAKRTSAQSEAVAKASKAIFRFADVSSVSNAPDARIKSRGHGCLPMMTPSEHFTLKAVEDEERGKCLEVALDVTKEKVNRYFTEYTTLWLKEPVTVETPSDSIGVWVKGNSSWGQVRFTITDRDGEEFVNYSHATLWDTLDWQGLLCVNFDGWAFVNCRFEGGLKYDAKTGLTNSPWNREKWGGKGSNGKIDFPITLRAVTVGMNRMKLDLLDFKPTVPVIRLGEVRVRAAKGKSGESGAVKVIIDGAEVD